LEVGTYFDDKKFSCPTALEESANVEDLKSLPLE
jgi:hypothetical protein